MPTVESPMFISSRLMAALTIEGVGTIHVGADGVDDGRVAYGCVIEDADGTVLYEGDGIRSGVGSNIDYTSAMATTLHFISHDAELYRACMGDWASADEDGQPGFNRAVAEWAYLNYDEITMVAYELDPDS